MARPEIIGRLITLKRNGGKFWLRIRNAAVGNVVIIRERGTANVLFEGTIEKRHPSQLELFRISVRERFRLRDDDTAAVTITITNAGGESNEDANGAGEVIIDDTGVNFGKSPKPKGKAKSSATKTAGIKSVKKAVTKAKPKTSPKSVAPKQSAKSSAPKKKTAKSPAAKKASAKKPISKPRGK